MSHDEAVEPVQLGMGPDDTRPTRPELRLATEVRGVDLAKAEHAATDFLIALGMELDVLVRGIPFRTVCEHHLLPFFGVVPPGYLPGERIVGLSKLARVVQHFAGRSQTQERLTKQVANCLNPRGAGVVMEAPTGRKESRNGWLASSPHRRRRLDLA
jgi:GTP cyclohydrolase I